MRYSSMLIMLGIAAGASHATFVQQYNATTQDTTLKVTNPVANGKSIVATSTGTGGKGVEGYGTTGVLGSSTSGFGVDGSASLGFGVRGATASGTGVWGQATSTGEGVVGTSAGSGNAVRGESVDGVGVRGISTNASAMVGYSEYGEGLTAIGYYNGLSGTGTHYNGTGVNGLGPNGGLDGYGVMGQGATGLYGHGNGTPSGASGYGVFATATGGDAAYGVYGNATMAAETWSGYFEGDVYVGGYFDNPSDIMFKKNVREYKGGLDRILSLKARSYDMKTEEFKDRVYLPKGPQVGFIAQELEQVMPELVHPVTAPAKLTAEERKRGAKKDPTKFKSVNYIALIPILVQAIQEQQKEIEALKAAQGR